MSYLYTTNAENNSNNNSNNKLNNKNWVDSLPAYSHDEWNERKRSWKLWEGEEGKATSQTKLQEHQVKMMKLNSKANNE